MIQKFPEVKKSQVAIVRVDVNTGHILDDQFNLATNINQKVYTIFEDIDSAIRFAKSIVQERRDIECNLYGEQMKFLQRISK